MQWMRHLGARLSQSRRARAAHTGRTSRRTSVLLDAMEPRILLSGDPVTSSAAGVYTVTFAGSDDTVGIHLVSDTSTNGGAIVDLTYLDDTSALRKITLGDTTNGVLGLVVDGGAGNDSFTTDALGVPLTIHGGIGTDTLNGPNVDTSWTISGLNAGFAGSTNPFDGVEKLVAGNKIDTLDYSAYASGISVSLAAGTASGFDSAKGFENVVGSALADTITGDGNANVLTGGGGANTLTGNGGTDTVIESGDVNFTLIGSTLTFGLASDTLASVENAILTGGSGANIFDVKASTLSGSVSLTGADGDDTYKFIDSQTGNFFLDETAGGVDTLDLSASTAKVEIDLSKVDAQAVSGTLTVTLSAVNVFENVKTGSGNDKITGNELDNVISGGLGNDATDGGIGNDTYVLGNNWGLDTVTEASGGNDGEGIDTIDFTAVTSDVAVVQQAGGGFKMDSGAANSLTFDAIEILKGGTGVNSLDFGAAGDAVVVNLAGGLSTDFSELSGFSNVTGSPFADTIIGNALANVLIGGAGDDMISGGGGADIIDGGLGRDTLNESRDVSFELTNSQLKETGTGIVGSEIDTLSGLEFAWLVGGASANVMNASGFNALAPSTALSALNHGAGVNVGANDLTVRLTDGSVANVGLAGATTVQDVLTAIHTANSRLTATINVDGNGIDIVDSTASGVADIQASSVSSLAADLGLAVTGIATQLHGTAVPGGGATLDGGANILLSLLNGGTGLRRTDLQQFDLLGTTPLGSLNQGEGVRRVAGADFRITLTDGKTVDVDLSGSLTTVQQVIDAIESAAAATVGVGAGRLSATIDPESGDSLLLTDSQKLGGDLTVTALNGSFAAADLGILREGSDAVLTGFGLTDISSDLRVTLADGTRLEFNLSGLTTLDDVLQLLNGEDERFSAGIDASGTGLDLFDASGGAGPFTAASLNGSFAAADLGLLAAGVAGKITGSSIVTGNLRLDGRLDVDTLIGGSGEDMLIGGGGADLITGGLGVDTVYANRDANLTLTDTTLTYRPGEVASISGIEKLVLVRFGDTPA